MKASELISKLQKLIEEHGDLVVACCIDHEVPTEVEYEKESWVVGYYEEDGRFNEQEAFEIK